MSRESDRIEGIIRGALTASPSSTFTVEDLAGIGYPGINRVEKRHYVAVRRAAYKVGGDLGWLSRKAEQTDSPLVFFNPFDVHSYAMGWLREDHPNWHVPIEILERRLSDPNDPQSRWEWVQPGGAWWQHVEIAKAHRDGHHEQAEAMAWELEAIVRAWAAARQPKPREPWKFGL
jgi:hypothetical protein